MTSQHREVIVGVDTHADTLHAAVVDLTGQRLGDAGFPATSAGYASLLAVAGSHGRIERIGVEGTASYGAGLADHLRAAGIDVREVIRPSRQHRRRRGKSDPADAYAAAAVALADDDMPTPKSRDGQIEQIRALLVARRSAVKARTAALSQIKALIVTAPEQLRAELRVLGDQQRLKRLSASRTSEPLQVALRMLARRAQALSGEVAELERLLDPLVTATAPALRAAKGVGPVTGAQLLVTAGDNPHRMRSKAAFAALCGVSPIAASSGKTTRYRLNRGGDRQANNALFRIVLVRMTCDQRTRDYVARRTQQRRPKKEIIRCLKRYVADEMFTHIVHPVAVPAIDDLRPLRHTRGLSLTDVAQALQVWPASISQIERGDRRDDELANRYREWLTAA
jgi:transposase